MTNYLELAELLEKAAKALREAHQALIALPPLSEGTRCKGAKGFDRLSVRTRNILNREVETLEQLCRHSDDEVLDFRNAGQSTLNEVREFLRANGLALRWEEVAPESSTLTNGKT